MKFTGLNNSAKIAREIAAVFICVYIFSAPRLAFSQSASSGMQQEESQRWSSFLPLWGKEARKRGYELPLPFGVSLNVYQERQDFEINDLKIALRGGDFVSIGNFVQLEDIDTKQTNFSLRLDAWLLPFLNLYGIGGVTEGKMRGSVFVPAIPIILPPLTIPLKINYEGPTYGGGVTLAGGFKFSREHSAILFAVADANWTRTDLDFASRDLESGSDIKAFIFSPRVGVRGPLSSKFKGAIWIGAMYQKVSQDFDGSVPALNLDFKIEQEPQHPWNTLVGGRLEAGQHFDFVLEGGFGGRKSILAAINYRF